MLIPQLEQNLMQGTAQRPEVRIVTWKNEELTTDALPVHGFEHYKAKDYALAHAPFTGFIIYSFTRYCAFGISSFNWI